MEGPREVAGRWRDAFNAHDEQAMRELTAPDATLSAPPQLTIEGAEAVTSYGMAWNNAFPDARLDVHHEVAEGDTVVQEFTFNGTHTATLASPTGDLPATNRRLSGRAIQAIEVHDGRVQAIRLYFDEVDVLTQLGLMPAAASAG